MLLTRTVSPELVVTPRPPAGDPPPFALTGTLGTRLDSASARGRDLMTTWLDAHPNAQRAEVITYISTFVPAVPADHRAEQIELDQIQATSTPQRETAAKWYAGPGFPYTGSKPRSSWWDERSKALDAATGGGAADARSAAKLLSETIQLAQDVWYPAQLASHEARPYTFHNPEPDGGWKPSAYTSHPSGHSTATFAAATAMAGFDSANSAQYLDVARKVAYSRLFNDMHWPHDVVAGALIGAMAGTAALRLPADELAAGPRTVWRAA